MSPGDGARSLFNELSGTPSGAILVLAGDAPEPCLVHELDAEPSPGAGRTSTTTRARVTVWGQRKLSPGLPAKLLWGDLELDLEVSRDGAGTIGRFTTILDLS